MSYYKIYLCVKNDNNYINIFKKFNITKIKNNDTNIEKIEKNSILITDAITNTILNIFKKKNVIIFTNLIDYINDTNFIYYKNSNELIEYLSTLFCNLNKSFTIIIPIYNYYKYLDRCIDSIKKQTFNNYKIFICDDNSDYNVYSKYKLKYSDSNSNISIFRNSKNLGKFVSINMVLDKIKTDYFLILDSDDKLNRNRLFLDLINFNKSKNILCVQSKYIRFDESNKNIIENCYGHTSISFKKEIINEIGYFCPNRFGSDTEYIMRIIKFLGKEKIFKYDKITYLSTTRTNKTNLTYIYGKEQRIKFIKKVNFVHANINDVNNFKNIKLDYFVDLVCLNENYNVDLEYYKKFYADLESLNDHQALKHWMDIGIKEGRLRNIMYFYNEFPNFDYKLFMQNNNFLTNKYHVFGYVYLKDNNNTYFDWLKKINTNYKKYINSKIINNSKKCDLEKYISDNKIKYLCISKALNHFELRMRKKFKLLKYNKICDKFDNTLFFGLYNNDDFSNITNHLGNKHLMWGGTDSNTTYDFRKEILNKIKFYEDINHLSISKDIEETLIKFNICSTLINFDLTDKEIFKPIKNYGNSIYIYNGFTKGNEKIYGKVVYDEVVKKLTNFKFIFSNDLNMSYEKMPQIYSQCFIGLRLTDYDGNANTVQEFNAMNIPIIFNGPNGIKWKHCDDIINTINKFYKKNVLKEEVIYSQNSKSLIHESTKYESINPESIKQKTLKYEIIKGNNNNVDNLNLDLDFYNDGLNPNPMVMELINKNIESFVNLIKDYKKILLICGDYPGYGGAATNCDKLQDFLMSIKIDTYAIYFNYVSETNIKLIKNDKHEIVAQNELFNVLKNLKFKPEAIITKNKVLVDLKKMFNCPIIFLVPGIFINGLDNYYYNLDDNEFNKYINKNILEQINNSDISFCNSSHTKNILLQKYNLNTYLFYSSFILTFNKQLDHNNNWTNRKFTFGLIISDFNRKIKNAEKTVQTLKNKQNVILIGKNSKDYSQLNKNFIYFDLIENNTMSEIYKEIMFVIQDSFYESCSNVMVEAISNGCNIIKKIIEINYNNLDQVIEIKKNHNYIIGNFTYFYENLKIKDLFKINSFETYIINQNQTKEPIIFINSDKDLKIKLIDLFNGLSVNNIKIGYNENTYSENELINLYYLYGYTNFNKNILGLNLFYEKYVNMIDNNKYDESTNDNLLLLIYSYYYGSDKRNYDFIKMKNEINKYKSNGENALIISKLIKGYGGVQKTSFQLIQTMDTKFNILILSNLLKNNKYDFCIDELNDDIPNILILKLNNLDDIKNYVNQKNFKCIINNKFEEILKIDFDKKINYISHNSMDPFNNLIIQNQNKIDKLFTINNFHRNLMYNNKFNKNIYLWNNYIYKDLTPIYKNKNIFTYTLGYVGRISKEKNIQLLIDGVNDYNLKCKNKVKLYIIGDGKEILYNLNDNIVLLGKLTFDEIVKYYDKFDYVISSSITEGKPFAIIEALSHGIPCIHSNINGINEIILDNVNGFIFDFNNYDNIKFETNFDCLNKIKLDENVKNITNVITRAYNINLNQWNLMSRKCFDLCGIECQKNFSMEKNLSMLEINCDRAYYKKYKIFVNFKPNENIAYGGGNISVYYISQFLSSNYSDFNVIYELEPDINIYLIIDPFKDNNFKKYSIDDVVAHRNNLNKNGKIIIRINDCDKTRVVVNNNYSREHKIITNVNNIDYFIFNSNFIKSYYFNKFNEKNISVNDYSVITNGCDENIFRNEQKIFDINKKIKIVTHHWSNNINKGYETYYKLWKYSMDNKNKNIEFVFIGKNVPDMFKEVPICGPLVGNELVTELNKCDIYITDSRFDSCPNHVLEALSCGIPILYSNYEGGAKELCEMSEYKVGEIFNDFNELIEKIDIIKNNYNYYVNNIVKSKYLYAVNFCVKKYYNVFVKNVIPFCRKINLKYDNNMLTILCKNENACLFMDELEFKLIKGNNIFAINKDTYKSIELYADTFNNINIFNDEFEKNTNKLNNNKLNILLCSDSNYFVGLFAVLHSVITNTNYLDKAHFNFIISIEDTNIFSKMLIEFEFKMNVKLDISIIYLHKDIINKTIFESKCYNSGGHLLNLGNLSRLLIGEFMEYKKLIYLDSDSIVQTDIIKKLLNFNLEKDLYSACANLENVNNKKRIVIKLNAIINCDYDWTNIIGQKINEDDYVYMGAPFITNCLKWANVYSKAIDIIKIHNNTEGGIYKLFTMSIQNILFYKNIGDIGCVLSVLQDLGSNRKEWNTQDLIYKDILDWSGIYKPWFSNGLYKNLWDHHDIMNLSDKYGIVSTNKNIVEKYDKPNDINNDDLIDKNYLKVSNNIFCLFQKYLIKMLYGPKTTITQNILFVCDATYLLKKMSRVRFWAIEELSKFHYVKLNITGPGFKNFDTTKTLQQNILNLNIKFDMVIWYKPLDAKYNYDPNTPNPFKTCLRYNEMWDEEWTQKEINESKTNIIICHHYNDYLRYKNELYKNDKTKEFYYLPHHAHPDIFKPLNTDKSIDILMSGVSKEKHYPLKHRLFNLINKHKKTTLSNYNIYTHVHPGYNNELSFMNINQINYNEIINKSKLCIACTSRYKYRLGKYVEIPMAGSVIVGDLPFEDKQFNDFVIEINMEMTDDEILNTIINALNNPSIIENKRNIGMEWAKNYTTYKYSNDLSKIISNPNKIFIISDEIREDHPEFGGQKWICDILKQEFMEKFPYDTTLNAKEANIIWYLAPWNYRYVPTGFKPNEWLEYLKNHKVIFTQHHIDEEKLKLGQLNKQFEFMKMYGNKLHAICNITKKEMEKYFNKSLISTKKLWINNNIFFNIKDKTNLRKKYNFEEKAYLVGSFQKDTEGQSNLPKLSKGPDIFVNIIKDMKETNPNIEVVLTGLRREYIINELEKEGIKYHYFNMVSLEEINELFNCLNLYVVSSRCEGGPRAVFEAGLTKTPIISTRVGIAPELMARSALFNANNWKSYKKTKTNELLLYSNVLKLTTDKYMEEFINHLMK